ncbi:MAG: hypothetical protein WCA01_15760 [Burkholderiales bacterium]
MPRALLAQLLAFGCAALLAGAPQRGWAATAQVSIEVPQGKVKSVRLRHLPRGTLVGIAISASARLGVALVGAKQLKSGKPGALFRAVLERRISFKVAIPESDDYYLVFDNRRGASPVSVTATVQAVQVRKRPRAPSVPKRDATFEQTRAASLPGV